MLKPAHFAARAAQDVQRIRDFFAGLPAQLAGWWQRRSVAWLETAVSFAGVAIGSAMFIGLLLAHAKFIAQPGPQEYNEPAIWQATWLLDHGRNPYSIQELPSAAYCFGPLYNYVVIAFSPLLGLDYSAHRMVSLIFLLGSMGVTFHAIRRAGGGLGFATLCVVFYYWMSLANIEITARPDTLGLFLFLLGLLVPWERRYSTGSTIFGLLCAVVAYNCKSYFALAGCATLLGHFLVRDRWRACWLGVGYFGLIGLTFAISCWLYPYYYYVTVLVQRVSARVNFRDDISEMHTTMLFERGWPFALMLLCGVGAWIWRRQRSSKSELGEATRREMPAINLAVVFIIFLSLVYFYMGHHAGAFFTYHLHLLFPLMFVLAALAVKARWLRIGFNVLLIAFFLAWVKVPPVPDTSAQYREMEQLVNTCLREVLGIPAVTDVLERAGRPVLHNGNTMFVGFAFADNRAEWDPKVRPLAKRFNELDQEVDGKIRDRAYGLVLTEFDNPYFSTDEVLAKYYDKVGQIDYYTYFGHSPVRVWRPKPVMPAQPSKVGL